MHKMREVGRIAGIIRNLRNAEIEHRRHIWQHLCQQANVG
jgi:hypothetical protein